MIKTIKLRILNFPVALTTELHVAYLTNGCHRLGWLVALIIVVDIEKL